MTERRERLHQNYPLNYYPIKQTWPARSRNMPSIRKSRSFVTQASTLFFLFSFAQALVSQKLLLRYLAGDLGTNISGEKFAWCCFLAIDVTARMTLALCRCGRSLRLEWSRRASRASRSMCRLLDAVTLKLHFDFLNRVTRDICISDVAS